MWLWISSRCASCPSQTPTCCGTSSWQRWRWARADSGIERVAKRPRANTRPFDPPDPFDPWPYKLSQIDPPFLRLLHRLLTAAQPRDRRDPITCQRWTKMGDGISGAVCNPSPSFLSSFLFSPFLPQVLWFLSLDADSRANIRKKKTTKNKENAVLYSWNSRCGGLKKELQNIHINNGHLRDLVNILKT